MPHTTTPWTFDPMIVGMAGYIGTIRGPDGDILAMVRTVPRPATGRANGYVFAAAADAIAALEDILSVDTDDDGDTILPAGFLDAARAIVAKAKGPSPPVSVAHSVKPP